LVLLLALAGLLAVNAAEPKPSPMFADFIFRQSSKTAKTTASDYYAEAENQCLKQVAYRNCRTCDDSDAGCAEMYCESKVACCHHDDYDKYGSDDDVLAEKATVGVCSYQTSRFGEGKEIHYEGTATTKIGTFTATCELKEDADKCGSPFCEGQAIVVTGDILSYPNVAFLHKPEPIDMDEDCKKAMGSARSAKIASSKPQYDYYEKPKYWVGTGEILSGTFYTVSRHHKIPYKFGQFQLVVGVDDDCEGVSELSEKSYVAKHEAIALEFFKEDGSYKA